MYVLQIPNGEYLRIRAAVWGNEIYYRLKTGPSFEHLPIFSVASKITADYVSRYTEALTPDKIVNPFWEICKVVEMRQA